MLVLVLTNDFNSFSIGTGGKTVTKTGSLLINLILIGHQSFNAADVTSKIILSENYRFILNIFFCLCLYINENTKKN